MSSPKTRIQKGKELENFICDKLRESGLDPMADRSHGSGNGNREKADIATNITINGRNIGIEAKNHATPHIKEWWKQTQKLEVLGREPILVYKLFGESMDEAKTVIYFSTFVEILKSIKNISNESLNLKSGATGSRQLEYSVSKIVDEIRKIKSLINK